MFQVLEALEFGVWHSLKVYCIQVCAAKVRGTPPAIAGSPRVHDLHVFDDAGVTGFVVVFLGGYLSSGQTLGSWLKHSNPKP